ncbi:hypothetical protein [Streptomyces cyaneogriseus]|uniref:hypothetical protein n=1 Tax=Streptomyces cyaneogriseus TaxID=68192 RepID=UPI001331BB26|nr:hypothetical protein [Streptomyces cyaneogriseus]
MAKKVYSIIEVARQGGEWEYSDLNFVAESTRDGGSVRQGWRQVRPAAIPGSGLAVAGSAEDDRRVYYQDVDRSLVQLSYAPSSSDGHWGPYRAFTPEIGAPSAAVGSALAVTGRIDGQRVHYFDGDRHPVRLEERPGGWTYTVCADGPPGSLISPLAAGVTEQGEYVYYLDDRGHIIEASWHGSQGWSVADLSAGIEGCPVPSPLTRLAATGYGSDGRLVYYLDERNRPVQLEHTVIAGTKKNPEGSVLWQVCDLSVFGAPAAAVGGPPALLLNAADRPRLCFLDADRMVVEVEFNGCGWDIRRAGADADLGAGAPRAAAGSALAAVAGADGSESHVYYLGTAFAGGEAPGHRSSGDGLPGGDDSLIELGGAGDKWAARDLGAELDLPDVATAVPSPIAAVHTSGPRVYYVSEE